MTENAPSWYRPLVAGDAFARTWWAVLLGAAAVWVAAAVTGAGLIGDDLVGFGLLAILVVFWDLRPIITSGGYDPQGVNLSTAFVFAALMRWGLGPALVILAAGTLAGEIARHKPVVNTIYNLAQYTLSYVAAWLVLRVFAIGPTADAPGVVVAGDILGILLAGAAYHLVNLALVGAILRTRSGRRFVDEFLEDFLYYTVSTAALLAVSPLLVVLVEVEVAFVLFLLPPLLAVAQTAAMSLRQEHRSQHDALTGLPNRQRLERVIGEATQGREPVGTGALLLLDLDRFKQVNDTLGHQAGDELLVQVAERLRGELRDGDSVARLGGDEFAIWLHATTPDRAVDIANRVRGQLRAPFTLPTMVVEVGCSVGIARFPDDGRTVDELLRCADVAMYAAKDADTGVEVYASERDHNTVSRLELVAELRHAITRGELVLHYQPKVRVSDWRIVGVEALVRWRHPVHGDLLPRDFLEVAEQAGLVREVTDAVLAEALAQVAAWRDQGLAVPVSVNVTPRDLADASFPSVLAAGLQAHRLGPELLRLEVTEHTLMEALATRSRVAAIADLGLQLSLDDFGTGYSSLSHLRDLPVTELKIDRSFVAEVHANDAIVRSVVHLAHDLGLQTVAEGVETVEDWAALRELGCDMAQGYLFSRPLPADEATACLARGQLDPVSLADPPARA